MDIEQKARELARAIDEADVGYSFNLTRLVDGEETHTLKMPGFPDLDFEDREEGYAVIKERKAKMRSDAIMAFCAAALTTQQQLEEAREAISDAVEVLEHVDPTGDDFDLSVEAAIAKGKAALASLGGGR